MGRAERGGIWGGAEWRSAELAGHMLSPHPDIRTELHHLPLLWSSTSNPHAVPISNTTGAPGPRTTPPLLFTSVMKLNHHRNFLLTGQSRARDEQREAETRTSLQITFYLLKALRRFKQAVSSLSDWLDPLHLASCYG